MEKSICVIPGTEDGEGQADRLRGDRLKELKQ
jgi:hypothetical protein